MILQELLDELRNNILRDVSDAVSSSQDDLLWSTEALVRYINDGYTKFVRETRILQDDTTEAVTQITLVADTARYPLDSRVLSVRAVSLNDVWLSRVKHKVMSGADSGLAINAASEISTTGRIFAYSVDKTLGYLQVYDKPTAEDAGGVLNLSVSRSPMQRLSVTNLGESLAIPEDYQLDILEWAAFKALRNHDTDGENAEKAELHRRSFFDAVNSARREVARNANAPVQFRPIGARWC